MKRTALASFVALSLTCICAANANDRNSWQIGSEGTWTLNEDYAYESNKGSASHLLTLSESIEHREAKIRIQRNMVDSYTFSVGCMMQSKTPVLTLKVPPLDIGIMDQSNGYAFARFIVDNNEEFALRGQVQKNGGIVFAPMTADQDQKLSNLFLQLREGAILKVALLQGKGQAPRQYEIALDGFMAFSETVLKDCERLNQIALSTGRKFTPLPDYITKEPAGLAPKFFTLKKGGLLVNNQPVVEEEKKEEEVQIEPAVESKEKPEPLEFVPDGSAASIGPDGKPIITKSPEEKGDDNIGDLKAPSLEFDKDGNPVFN